MNEYSPYNIIKFETAIELWNSLSPLNPIKKPPSKFIFRGQGNACWGLQPSVLRDNSLISSIMNKSGLNSDSQVFSELAILVQFVNNCDLIGVPLPKDSIKFREIHLDSRQADMFYKDPSKWPNEELIELMVLAQHHGLPTRLLDWTRRSFIAAYFAASGALSNRSQWKEDDELAVWALDTELINLFQNIKIIKAPGAISQNLAAQAGEFTLLKLEGTRRTPVEKKCLEDEFKLFPETPLWKFTLPVKQAKEILKLCSSFGVSAATLFPGYNGASKAVIDTINMWEE